MPLPVLLLLALLALSPPAPARAQPFPFVHPGILIDTPAIHATRADLARQEPVKTAALAAMRAHPLASLEHIPQPHAAVICGPFDKPSIGCRQERDDAKAAYTHALLWAYLREPAHADKAIAIMDQWAGTLVDGHQDSNAPLQAAWAAQLWTRAAELMRHTSDRWPADHARHFGQWLLTQYLPDIERMGPCPGGNWFASGIEARMNIGVYTDRHDLYEQARAQWQQRLPTYVYLSADGATPQPRPGCGTPLDRLWFGQTVMADGLAEETCRDLEHTAYGLAGYLNAAETDRIQGGNLFALGAERLTRAMEFHTRLMRDGQVPDWLCRGKLVSSMAGTLELGYQHYAVRAKTSLPATAAWLGGQRPSRGDFHFLWETLTHGAPLAQ